MPKVRLVRDTPQELRFAHPHVSGWIFLAIGVGVAWAGLWLIDDDRFGRWLVTGMGVLFAVIGFGGALWRYDLTLDLLSRTFRGRRGFWPAPKTLSGSLDELKGVVLTRVWRRSSSSNGGSHDYVVWQLGLEFEGWQSPLSFYESRKEEKAYEKLEQICRRLGLPALDRSGDEEVRRSPDDLDRTISGRSHASGDAPVRLPETPPGSAILIDRDAGPVTIVLPATGFSAATLFFVLFGLAFASFGCVALLSAAGLIPLEVTGSPASIWIVSTVFLLIGLGICALGIVGSYARETIREEGDGLTFSFRFLGRELRPRTLPKREIEEIGLSERTNSPRRKRNTGSEPAENLEVVVRSDRKIVRLASELTAEEQRWLRDCLTFLTAR